jgi:hypothetical protein
MDIVTKVESLVYASKGRRRSVSPFRRRPSKLTKVEWGIIEKASKLQSIHNHSSLDLAHRLKNHKGIYMVYCYQNKFYEKILLDINDLMLWIGKQKQNKIKFVRYFEMEK